jgi:uncharacterized membrane protein YjjP (DUF1212 family)
MSTTSNSPRNTVLTLLAFGYKSLILALLLSALFKLLFSDGGWVNYGILAVVLILGSFIGRFISIVLKKNSR